MLIAYHLMKPPEAKFTRLPTFLGFYKGEHTQYCFEMISFLFMINHSHQQWSDVNSRQEMDTESVQSVIRKPSTLLLSC